MNARTPSLKPRIRGAASLGRKALVLISTLLTLACVPAHAEILLSEAFSYPDGPVVSAPATQWQNQEGAAGQIEVLGGKLALRDGGFEVVSALLAGRPHTAGTLYTGFTVRFFDLPSGVSHFAAFNAENGLRNLGRLYATTEGAAPGYLRIGLSTFRNPLNNTVPVDLSPYQEFRVVLRYEPQTLGVTVWVNPVTEAEGGVQPQEDFSTFPSPISSLVFRQNPDTGDGRLTLMVDNLVVATTFAEAKDAPPGFIWEYTVQNGSATITRFLGGTGPDVVMPETLGGAPVRSFRPGMFQFGIQPGLNLTLPSGITNISEGEFQFSRLSNVTFLGPIRAIPFGAFFGCSRLVSVTYPDTVTSIGDGAFSSCPNLRDIRLPAGLTRIGADAFWFCRSLKTNEGRLTIPASVTVIGDRAFRGCASLEAIEVDPLNASFSSLDGVLFNKTQTILLVCPAARSGTFAIPETVTTIRISAFADCKKLTGMTIPESIRALPDNAFGGCTGLTRLDLPSGLTSLGTRVFSGTGLTNVSLPAGVRTIPGDAYGSCPGLVSVTIPDHITRVDTGAFANCDNLTDITVPSTVTTLGAGFMSGASLTRINVEELNPNYASVDGVLFNKAGTTLLAYPRAKPGNYQIPDGVRIIGVTTFAGATFSSLTIPASVTSIQERAFEFCPQLTSLVIPDTVTSLGVACFQFCDQLTSVRVGRGITTLPANAFSFCPMLSDVKLPDTLRTIADQAFFRCLGLHRITIPASVRTLGVLIFDRDFYDDTNILEVYFEGNRPTIGLTSPFGYSASEEFGPTVYYRAGTTGWGAIFASRPTVLWDPRVTTGDGTPGIRDGKFGFTITGAAGLSVAVEACTDLANPVWVRLGTQVLTDGKRPFVDADSAIQPSRFYRFQFP